MAWVSGKLVTLFPTWNTIHWTLPPWTPPWEGIWYQCITYQQEEVYLSLRRAAGRTIYILWSQPHSPSDQEHMNLRSKLNYVVHIHGWITGTFARVLCLPEYKPKVYLLILMDYWGSSYITHKVKRVLHRYFPEKWRLWRELSYVQGHVIFG
jgi:hypothetical protein